MSMAVLNREHKHSSLILESHDSICPPTPPIQLELRLQYMFWDHLGKRLMAKWLDSTSFLFCTTNLACSCQSHWLHWAGMVEAPRWPAAIATPPRRSEIRRTHSNPLKSDFLNCLQKSVILIRFRENYICKRSLKSRTQYDATVMNFKSFKKY